MTAFVAPSKTSTCGPPPGPAPVMMSAFAVSVQVAGGDKDAARKRRRVRIEGANRAPRRPVEHLDMRAAAGAGACDDVADAVAVDVTRSNSHATAERRVIGVERAQHRVRGAVERLHLLSGTYISPSDHSVSCGRCDRRRDKERYGRESRSERPSLSRAASPGA